METKQDNDISRRNDTSKDDVKQNKNVDGDKEKTKYIEKLRYLSLSEETMKNIMDCGVLTVGGFVQFTTEVEIYYDDCMKCLDKLIRKYEQLQMNTVYDKQKKKFYWAKMEPEFVHTTEDLGFMNQEDAQNKFNKVVKLGIHDGDPIWKFYFVRIINSSSGNQEIESSGDHTDLISSTGNSGCTNQNDNKGNSHHASNTTAEERNGMMRYSIFFVLSHALVDGIGMATMVQDYSTFVCQVLERRKRKLPVFVDEEECVEVLKICPPYEKLVPNLLVYRIAAFPICIVSDVCVRLLFKFGYVPVNSHDLFNSTRLKPMTSSMSQDERLNVESFLRTECVRFTPQEWANFQKFRRQNGLTVTGLGLALFAVSLMKFAYEGLKWPRTYLGAHVLRDPRLYFKKGELDPRALVGNYIAAGLLLVLPFLRRQHKKPLRKIVTDTARLITEQIRGNFKNFASFFNGELQHRISRNRKLVKRAVEVMSNDKRSEGRFTMIQFSNVGEVNCLDPELCGDYNAVTVEKSIGVADQSKCGDCFCLILSTVQGSLFWSISYPGQLYSQETVHALGQELRNVWTEVIQPEPDLEDLESEHHSHHLVHTEQKEPKISPTSKKQKTSNSSRRKNSKEAKTNTEA
ncbi:uncharacterized protein LOC142345702 [Convolutriloba macropyga]|uniref:uncharacterized protein LOC142345702 n=1 Tax=Convolutriloba macropyga TaxID=536237 RepID=UPI003F51C872